MGPLHYLTQKAKAKCYEITDFLGLAEEICEHVVIKSGPRKTRLKNVTPAQWGTANIRILTESLRTGALEQSALYDYLAYTIKVGEMADQYNWQSILQYDRAYRIQQATHGFRWGSDSPHLTTVHLRDEQHNTVWVAVPLLQPNRTRPST